MLKKRQHRDKANEGVQARDDDDESSQIRTDKQKKEDAFNRFDGQSIRRSELYEGIRGNRNPFDEANNANVTRNPLWMKQAEVEEEPLELQFWEAPNKGQVERDDDEVITDRAYDPAIDSFPKEESNQNDLRDEIPALTVATPGASPFATPKRAPTQHHSELPSQISGLIELSDLKAASPSGTSPSADDFTRSPKGRTHPRHHRVKSHDDNDDNASPRGSPKPERDDD